MKRIHQRKLSRFAVVEPGDFPKQYSALSINYFSPYPMNLARFRAQYRKTILKNHDLHYFRSGPYRSHLAASAPFHSRPVHIHPENSIRRRSPPKTITQLHVTIKVSTSYSYTSEHADFHTREFESKQRIIRRFFRRF